MRIKLKKIYGYIKKTKFQIMAYENHYSRTNETN